MRSESEPEFEVRNTFELVITNSHAHPLRGIFRSYETLEEQAVEAVACESVYRVF